MPDYSQSKIYQIQPIIEHDEGDIYIGSTTKNLNTRFTLHKSNFKRYIENKYRNTSSFYIFEKYGIENCEIVLLEEFNCETRCELFAKEKEYILNNKCVNKFIPTRTEEEYKKYQAEYYKEHKEYRAEYRERNKDAILNYQAEYREQNKEKIKNYYQQNKDAIKQRKRERYKQLKEQEQKI